jgi:four helix bundle protein
VFQDALLKGIVMKIRTFRDLIAWQKGMDLTREIYRATVKMPREEMFGLTSQMRRASSSIPMNIAEGFGKHTRPEFVHGLRTAMGSLCELMTAYELATSMELIAPAPRIFEALQEEDRVLQALIRSLEIKTARERQAKPRRNNSP